MSDGLLDPDTLAQVRSALARGRRRRLAFGVITTTLGIVAISAGGFTTFGLAILFGMFGLVFVSVGGWLIFDGSRRPRQHPLYRRLTEALPAFRALRLPPPTDRASIEFIGKREGEVYRLEFTSEAQRAAIVRAVLRVWPELKTVGAN